MIMDTKNASTIYLYTYLPYHSGKASLLARPYTLVDKTPSPSRLGKTAYNDMESMSVSDVKSSAVGISTLEISPVSQF